MRKIPLTLLIVLSSVFLTKEAVAQNKPLACQTDVAAGLIWENGRWVTKSFINPKFILVLGENTLTTDSVGKALVASPTLVNCRNFTRQISCNDTSGGNLYFDMKTLTGGISQLFGSTNTGAQRDTVTVQVFSCTPF